MQNPSSEFVRHDAASRDDVFAGLRLWARRLRDLHPEVLRVGCFGSYARGDYVPSSDVDIVVEVAHSAQARWIDRAEKLPAPSEVPAGADVFIYTSDEIRRMTEEGSGWWRRIAEEAVWV